MKTAEIESGYAWLRLVVCLALTTIGSAGMFVVVVAMPAFELDMALTRAQSSVPYTVVMVGFGAGGVVIGGIVDRFGIVRPLGIGAVALAFSYALASASPNLLVLNIAHILIGCFGCAVVFAPLISDISKWFNRRRGLAVAICACGNYVSGALWPPIMNDMMVADGWRETYFTIGLISAALMLPLLLLLNRKPVGDNEIRGHGGSVGTPQSLGLTPNSLLFLLCLAGVGCCMAMAMPQVHMVTLCGDRGYGAARGAEMLSLMLGCGVISRLGFGWISDRLGGLRTIIISSSLQGVALFLFLFADTLTSLYIVSALFGLFQGGIVPCYALIVREFYPESEAGSRLGTIILATLVGMALGGWTSGVIFDETGSYTVAFLHGIGWNLVNLAVIIYLLVRVRSRDDIAAVRAAG